jgi:uncharacterized membrane protein YedE/YeeE
MDVSALIGGMMIGLSAAVLWVFNGRIAGISGMISSLGDDQPPKYLPFLLGLIGTGWVISLVSVTPEPATSGLPLALLSGALVGLGTFLANGCTSGHAVCGIARLSVRSITSTVIFMLVAGITVYLKAL